MKYIFSAIETVVGSAGEEAVQPSLQWLSIYNSNLFSNNEFPHVNEGSRG